MIDGIVLNHIASELKNILVGGRIDKITQPEKDELIIHIRAGGQKKKIITFCPGHHAQGSPYL